MDLQCFIRFLSSEKAVSEVVGHSFIFALTIIGVASIVLFGLPSIDQLQDMALVRNAEQNFLVLDMKAAKAIFGDSPAQIVDFRLGGGILAVEPNGTGKESYMTITRSNESDVIEIPMGKVKYRLLERTVAYEGGGIWSKYPSGGSVMVSPPEFQYNGKTLTLPVVNVSGNSNIGGMGTAAISFKKNSRQVLYPASQGSNRTNPLNFSKSGRVYINITSEFYDAWAGYARSLKYTKVFTNSTRQTASIELTVVPSTLGMDTPISNPINFRGLLSDTPTPLENFSFKISSAKNNLKWDIRAKSGGKTLIFFLKDDNNWAVGNNVSLEIGYQDSSVPGNGETWHGDGLYTIQPDNYIYVDLLSKDLTLKYENEIVGANNANQCQTAADKVAGIHNPDYSWGGIINVGNTQSLYNITQHYASLMSVRDFSFFQCDSGGNEPNSQSTMLVNYNTTGGITFLYITNNTVDVSMK